MGKYDEENNTDEKLEKVEETLKSMWELITKMSDDIFEVKRKMGLEVEFHKGKRSDYALRDMIDIAIKKYPILHPSSVFDIISYHLAFSDGIDTDIYVRSRIGATDDDVFVDETKKKIFDDWENKNKD